MMNLLIRRRIFDKEDGIQARHMVMSFDVNDDVTVESAKQIGDELLQHKLFENFQVVYAVHKDKKTMYIYTFVLTRSIWKTANVGIKRLPI